MAQLVFRVFIEDRACNFDPARCVTCHKICGRYVNLFVFSLAKAIYTRMLQKTADYADDFYIVCFTWNAGNNAAYTAHDKFYFNTGTRGFYKFFDERLVC